MSDTSFKNYLLINGVTCSVVEFARHVSKTPDALRKNYKSNVLLIDAYIEQWKNRK